MKLRAGTISTDPFSVPLTRAHFFCRSRHLFQVCSLYPVPLLPGHCKQSLWLCTVSSTLAAGPQPPGSAGKSLASVDRSPAGSLQAVTVTLHMHLLQGHSHREALVNNSQVSTNHPTAGSLYPVPLLPGHYKQSHAFAQSPIPLLADHDHREALANHSQVSTNHLLRPSNLLARPPESRGLSDN